jgi:hypothetical protein
LTDRAGELLRLSEIEWALSVENVRWWALCVAR